MSLAARLENSIVSPQTKPWVRQFASESIHARLAGVHFDLESLNEGLEEPSSPSSPLRGQYSRSIRSGSYSSSPAPTLIHQYAPSSHPPCYTGTEATPTETSISTGLANHLPCVPLLEDNSVLELPATHVQTPVYECAFWFVSCEYISRNQEEWITHCESHFRGEEPPQKVQCPLCDWTATSEDGRASWSARMQHIAYEHTMLGHTLRTSRPDFDLFHHLWQKRIIDDQDYKELLRGNNNLGRPPGNFVESNGRDAQRERGERRYRRRHVTATRSSGLQPV
jgi:hypothetical protein